MGRSLTRLHAEYAEIGDPYCGAEIALAADATTPRRAANWVRQVHAVERYRHDHGSLPVARPGDRASTALADFLRYQRRLWRRGDLTDFQIARLEIAGCDFDPRGSRWDDGLARYEALLQQGVVPSRRVADPVERRAGDWLDFHRRELRAGRMPSERRAEFRDLESRRDALASR